MQLGMLGVWAGLDGLTAANALAFAQRTEKRGYKALWTPESRGSLSRTGFTASSRPKIRNLISGRRSMTFARAGRTTVGP